MQRDVQRILDANLNRAREAMRVLEDYARFVLDDQDMCEAIKIARHDLSSATRPIEQDLILHRDAPVDVGRDVKVESELARSSPDDVVIAAGKRLGEALRSIEEYLKVLDGEAARRVEAVRYRAYAIESELARRLNRGARMRDVRLCVLITQSECAIPWEKAAEEAIAGGARCLQLREKELDGGELVLRARRLAEMCRKTGVLLIVNDRVDVALAGGADGVHLGQTDISIRDARQMLGAHRIIGKSTHDIEQARQASMDGADYIGVGPMFESQTKVRDFVAGVNLAREVAREIRIPIDAGDRRCGGCAGADAVVLLEDRGTRESMN
jgi:thiamine-phosphate pyrophosphorylase